MVYSIISISILGFIVMYHHMFSIGLDIDSKVFYNSSTIIIGLPTGIKIYSWITSLYYKETYSQENCIEYLIYIYYFISLFIMGGVTGIILSSSIIDLSLHDTYFVVGHFHMVLSIGVVMCVLLEYILGVNITFIIMHIIGLNGLPRRYNRLYINRYIFYYININRFNSLHYLHNSFNYHHTLEIPII
ncbi:Cytochrome c oxidase, subunit I domain-containing protein [Rozella allomycis CSF55]|uniref:Cytochrome c oxidase, subunit I domain-containing protein n=1 Tax=Rozella allomycis (strain CSF55) TaxID=988480 RepID=A0A075AWR9_ROZAC|nr:Cytochrome c oxidase, subunit I domain-containing protein [Rozella allomycis CSF55]|eukprot:EPZ33137.1 Cytochrome c oxidase, subunit I domain-containing protein [Rozella allomycis CSF55]